MIHLHIILNASMENRTCKVTLILSQTVTVLPFQLRSWRQIVLREAVTGLQRHYAESDRGGQILDDFPHTRNLKTAKLLETD